MYNKVIFYNHGHLGDTLLSKPFIKEIKKLIPAQAYAISNDYGMEYIADTVDEHIPTSSIPATPSHKFLLQNNELYVNTWCPWCFPADYLEKIRPWANDGIDYNFDVYRVFINEVLKNIDISYSIEHMDENKGKYTTDAYDIKIDFCEIPRFYDSTKRVLIFNQPSFSGQGDHMDYSPMIAELASNYTDTIFYTSQQHNCRLYNVVSLQNYLQMPDLFKIGIFSTQCDIVVGPGNAPLIATWIKPNIDNKNKTYIVMNQLNVGATRWYQGTNCKFVTTKSIPELFANLYQELILRKY